MRFAVRAVQNGCELVTLGVDAGDAAEAERLVTGRGLDVLSVVNASSFWSRWARREQKFDLTLFSQELLSLLDAGIAVVEAIETLLEKEARPDARRVLVQVVSQLRDGQALSGALQRQPEAFSPLYVATVRASERTSDLAQGLARYIAYANQVDLVRNKIVSASIYPLLLVGAGTLVMLFLLGYVVPRFGRIYADLGNNLPFLSRLLLHWGKLVEAQGLLLLALLVAAGIAAWKILSSNGVRRRVVDRLWAVPALGARLQIYQLARFYRTLGMLLRGGIPIAHALDMVSGLLQPAYRGRLDAAVAAIREGKPISDAFGRNGLTTPVAMRMLRVGERSGQMGEMMERTAAFYDGEFSRWVEWFVRLFEPLLMAVIGLAIGVIVVLMYLPIFELAGGLR